MDEAFQISVGEKMELRPQLSDGSYSSSSYLSQIQNILSENEFQILSLTDNNPDSWVGRVLLITIVQDDVAYAGTAKIEKIVNDGNLAFFNLVLVEKIKQAQRRDYYRLKIKLEIEIGEYGKFRTYDISGNGLAFLSDKKIEKGQVLAITLHLKDDIYDICGIVVRCSNVSEKKFLVSIHFKDIGERLQDEIASFLHKQQLVMLRKGILQ